MENITDGYDLRTFPIWGGFNFGKESTIYYYSLGWSEINRGETWGKENTRTQIQLKGNPKKKKKTQR